MAAERDSVLGEIKGRIPLFKNAIDDGGSIIMYENGILVDVEGNRVRSPFAYVKHIDKTGDMALAKVGVNLVVYDQLGEKYDFDVCMSDQHLLVLRKACGKE